MRVCHVMVLALVFSLLRSHLWFVHVMSGKEGNEPLSWFVFFLMTESFTLIFFLELLFVCGLCIRDSKAARKHREAFHAGLISTAWNLTVSLHLGCFRMVNVSSDIKYAAIMASWDENKGIKETPYSRI